jgi:hypothetical protein
MGRGRLMVIAGAEVQKRGVSPVLNVRRRDFIALLGGAAAAWPLIASAQQSSRRIGILMGTAESDPDQQALVSTFVHALGELGWRDGENIRTSALLQRQPFISRRKSRRYPAW